MYSLLILPSDLPTIKYLKDDQDDCDLDPQLYVSDLLLDEGKAQRDGDDQRVTIKVVLEQGRTPREGSVAIGGLLDDPQFRLQLQTSSRPPVPKFPAATSSLGKRPPSDYPAWALNGTKRQRQAEILDPLREDSLISSIEREHPTEHLHVVAATQSPLLLQAEHSQHLLHTIKAESPELWGTWRDIPAATIDELEALSEEPQGFSSWKRNSRTRAVNGASRHQRPNGTWAPSTETETLPSLPHPNPPITPIPEVSRHASPPHPQESTSLTGAVRAASHNVSTSAGKFKRTVPRSIYDLPESDIDDSQMSPRSKTATLHRDKSRDRFSRIENLRSPSLERDHDQGFTITEAIAALDNESVFNDPSVTENDFRTQGPPLTENGAAATDHSSDDVYEDAETSATGVPATDPKPGQVRTVGKAIASIDTRSTNNADNQVSVPTVPRHKTPNVHDPETNSQSAAKGGSKKREAQTPRTKPNRKRSRMSRSGDGSSKDDTSVISSPSSKAKPAAMAHVDPHPSSKQKVSSNQTPCPDSLDEQLSQSLQQSAQKSLKKKTTGSKSGSEAANSEGKASKRVPTSTKADRKPEPPSITVNLAKETVATSKPPKAPATRGSGPKATIQREASSSNMKPNALVVDDRTEARKSPSVPIGLTEEEIKTMKSREGMTKEEYEADKRRKQLEQKHVDAAKKRESFGKPAKTKPVTPTLQGQSSVSTSSKTNASNPKSSKNVTVELSSKGADVKKATAQDTESGKSKERSQKQTLSSPSKDGLEKPARNNPNKTPAKLAPRNAPGSKDLQTPKKLADSSKVQSSTQKPKSTHAPPTIQQARSLKNLHAALKTAHENATSSANSSRNSSRPNQKKSILVVSDDDTSDDESSEDESESDDNVPAISSTVKLSKGTTGSGKANPPTMKTETKSKKPAETPSSSSSSSIDSDEDAYERKQTEAAKLAKSALTKPRSTSLSAVSPASASEGLRNRQPDPSIRDASIELSDDSSQDDEDSESEEL